MSCDPDHVHGYISGETFCAESLVIYSAGYIGRDQTPDMISRRICLVSRDFGWAKQIIWGAKFSPAK
jgi:hypothetical protein